MRYNEQAAFSAPFVYTGLNKQHSSAIILLLIMVQLVVMGIMQDFASIVLILTTSSAVCLAAMIVNRGDGNTGIDIHALLYGLLMGFFLPVSGGFFFSFTIAFAGYIISWGVFGGKGNTWMNPVMLAVCIAAVSKPELFTHTVSLEQIQQSGSVFAALENTDAVRIAVDQRTTSILNTVFLSSIGVTLPEGYISLFFFFPSAIPAFRYNLLTIVSSIILLSFKIINKTIPFTFLTVYSIFVYFYPLTIHQSTSGDILSALLTSGALFIAFFIMHDSGSIPRSACGRFTSGILTGILAFCIAGPGVFPAGIPFAVLLSNCFTPLIEHIELIVYRRKRGTL